MNRTAISLLLAIPTGLFAYINYLAVIILPYCNASSIMFQFCFMSLCVLGALISIIAILYKNHSLLQFALRWVLILVFFVIYFLIGAHVGLVGILCNCFDLSINSSSDNISGMLAVSYIFVVFIASLIIALGKIATTSLMKFISERKTS